MTYIQGSYFDGESSHKLSVHITFTDSGEVLISGDALEQRYALREVRISSRLGNTPRYLNLPGGGKCEVADNAAVDAALRAFGGTADRGALHLLESKLRFALAALIITVAVGWGFVEYAIPAIARHVAGVLPASLESSMGEQGLAALDKTLFAPTALSGDQRTHVNTLFESVVSELSGTPRPRLVLRSSPRIGANAFALPSGIVVVTDEIVRLARHDDELTAILAHELGHVRHRHIMRQLLQGSMTALLLAAVLGDVTSITGLSATLPTFLVEQKYSRVFELEADAYAGEYLRRHGIPASRLTDILRRITEQTGGSDSGVANYLSSHPATKERGQALRKGGGE